MLRLNVEALDVASFETQATPTKEKEQGGTETRMPVCTHCTDCNWTV